jgi:hypothetical protein
MMSGGVVPGGMVRSSVWLIAVTSASAAPMLGVGVEEDADQPDAGERLRLDVLDAVDGGRHGPLGYRDHAALDLGGEEPAVLPDDRDDGDVDLGEDVDRASGRSSARPRWR